MKKLLITGAGGFLGGHLVLQAAGRFEVNATFRTRRPKRFPALQIDLADAAGVAHLFKTVRPQIVIHAAANSKLDECEVSPQTAFRDNVVASRNLTEAAAAAGARLIYVSTDTVFDGLRGHYREIDEVNPLSVYGRTKLAAERMVQEVADHVIVRTALIYGRPVDGGASFSDWLEKKLLLNEPAELYDDQYRTPILVDNLAELLLELADNRLTGLLHAGGLNRVSRLQFGEILCEVAGYDRRLLRPISMDAHQLPALRPRDASLNCDKIRSVLQTPLLGVREGVMRMIGASID